MKALSLILSTCGLLGLFSLGLALQSNADSSASSGRIHLNCWDESGASSIQRIRFTLDQNLQGRAWTSSFAGEALEDGSVVQTPSSNPKTHFTVNIVTAQKSWMVELPKFIFNSPLRTLKITFSEGESQTELECRKLDLTHESDR